MKVVQIIDSLDAGGAERMAVNYANCLKDEIEFSGLVVTRDEGVLKSQIESGVHLLNLKRKGTFDFKAILKLRKFLSKNKIEVIHTHGSSFFIGVLVKLIYFRIKLIWHDHYGDRVKDSLSNNWYIKIASLFFNGVIVCNNELLEWAKKNLFGSKHVYLPNFTVNNLLQERQVVLKGIDGKRIVCLSNLRNPKNHMVLLEGFYKSGVSEKGWTLHLIGKDNKDLYSEGVKEFIRNNDLADKVFLYGAQNNVYSILSQSTIGVLASNFEGFPVVLLEYGQSGLAVISSNVGQCPEIILDGKNGLLFQPHDALQLAVALQQLTEDETLRMFYSSNLKSYVYQNFSGETIIQKAILFYKSV